MSLLTRAAFFFNLTKGHILKKNIPLMIVLNCTNHCNLRCGYCYGEYYKPVSKEQEFSTVQLFALIDELSAMGTKSLTLAGGEPLLREDIGKIINRIKSRKMECGMNTNGILIPHRLKELQSIDMVTVSIDGPKGMNDADRGGGSFEKIISGIDAALGAGIKVHINTVLTRHNLDGIDWIIDFARERKIHAEFNVLFQQSAGKRGTEEFLADQESYRKALTYIADLKSKGAPILFSEGVYRFASRWPNLEKRVYRDSPPDFNYIRCFSGRFMGFIDSDGRVYPCPQLIDSIDAKNCKEVGFKAAWGYLAQHDCKACYFPCFNEFSRIMGFHLPTIFQQIFSTLRGH